MPIVRESPRAKLSPEKNSTQWPPRSPFQALLSSPSGRKKWQEHHNRRRGDERSVSPSPVKKAPRAAQDGEVGALSTGEDDEDEEEDEEMLELKLEALKTKLKLKKLRRAKEELSGKGEGTNSAIFSRRADSALRTTSPRPSSLSRTRRKRGDEDTDTDVQVPLSPTKERNPPLPPPTSPARARLGLSTTAKAQDVSLKRARDGTHLPRSDTRRALTRTEERPFEEATRPATSFSERLARSKEEAQARNAKEEKIERVRSKGFGVGATSAAHSRRSDVTSAAGNGDVKRTSTYQTHTSSKLDGGGAVVSNITSTRTSKTERQRTSRTNGMFTFNAPHAPLRDDHKHNSNANANHADSDSDSSLDVQGQPDFTSNEDQAEPPPHFYDPFTQTHLSKRHLSHTSLTREMADKEIYTLPRLLKEVKAPHYDPPDCETDFVLFAILASKSSPYDQKATHRTNDENEPQQDPLTPGAARKFMVLHLTDLKWDCDLFLFGTAFDRFWKLTPGTLLAILNPGVMPPKGGGAAQHSGRFCLKLASSEDSVLEIGVARDLGCCASVRKDGRECGAWVDKRKTEVCAFHLEMAVERDGRRGRMEVNGMWRSHEGSAGGGGGGRRRGERPGAKAGAEKNGAFHREYGRLYDVPPTGVPGGPSVANLLDAEDKPFLLDSAEASRKRIAAAQRERDLAKKLGQMGHGVGAEYLRSSTAQQSSRSGAGGGASDADPASPSKARAALFEKPSASALGLLANRAEHARLSPAKDRKRHFGVGAVSSAGSEAMGWGGARNAGLLQPKERGPGGSPEKGRQTTMVEADRGRKAGVVRERSEAGGDGRGTGSQSPSKKRARFALEQGIREPGRESLGQSTAGAGDPGTNASGPDARLDDGDDDDELDIV